MKSRAKVSVYFIIMLGISLVSFNITLVQYVTGWTIQQPFYKMMLLECLVVFGVLAIALAKTKKTWMMGVEILFIVNLFAYLHRTLLPLMVAFLYGGTIILVGYSFVKLLKIQGDFEGIGLWTVVGCSIEIIISAVLSACNLGHISCIKNVWWVLSFLCAIVFLSDRKTRSDFRDHIRKYFNSESHLLLYERIIIAAITVCVLVQVGRVNLALDWDTAWYGGRPESVLANGPAGIFEDLGLIASVFTYPKGFEILSLPIAEFSSYAYILSFNIFWTILSGVIVYKISRINGISRPFSLLTLLFLACISGIMNMSITAKPDTITMLFQLLMIYFFLVSMKTKKRLYLFSCIGAYIFTFSLKPTSLVFSTVLLIVFVFLYLIWHKKIYLDISNKNHKKNICKYGIIALIPPTLATGITMLRTYLILGLPIASIASGVMGRLGFTVNPPYSTGTQSAAAYVGGAASLLSKESLVRNLKKLYHIFFRPVTAETDHICIAWGTMIITLLIIFLIGKITWKLIRGKMNKLQFFWSAVFIALFGVSIVSMILLPKPDGNYFMILYAVVPIAYFKISEFNNGFYKKLAVIYMPVLIGAFMYTCAINWSWSQGFTPIDIVNRGYYAQKTEFNNKLKNKAPEIYDKITEEGVRLFALGDPIYVDQLPAVSESWWSAMTGNNAIINTIDAFETYLELTEKDYIFADKQYMFADADITFFIRALIEEGILSDMIVEKDKVLFSINFRENRERNSTSISDNVQVFDKMYEKYCRKLKNTNL